MEKFYTAGQLARSGLLPYRSKDTIVKLINEGKLKSITTGSGRGTRHYIKFEDVEEFLNKFIK